MVKETQCEGRKMVEKALRWRAELKPNCSSVQMVQKTCRKEEPMQANGLARDQPKPHSPVVTGLGLQLPLVNIRPLIWKVEKLSRGHVVHAALRLCPHFLSPMPTTLSISRRTWDASTSDPEDSDFGKRLGSRCSVGTRSQVGPR